MSHPDHAFDVHDVEYLRHGDQPLLARVYVPRGTGPFPAVVELHGGAWSQFDRLRDHAMHEALARSGVVVVALDFRQGAEGAYPKSVADIHYGIRWAKANAARFRLDPARVGIAGNSSGAHLAMLVAMRPFDPRYGAIPLPPGSPAVDARVQCVAMLWPVINPSGRYRYAQRLQAAPDKPDWVDLVIGFHHAYWVTEEAMREGNPTLMLERGEQVDLPPAAWLIAQHDEVHNYHDPDSDHPGTEPERFADRYRAAGGSIDVYTYDAGKMFTVAHPTLPASVAAMQQVVDFVHRHLGR